jgi:hypothetical protein
MTAIDSSKVSAARPNRLTVYLRTFLPWQALRFILINLRMTVMIVKSHGGRAAHQGAGAGEGAGRGAN